MNKPSLKIVQILEATLGGTARHVLDLCKGLRGRGHEVHLLYNPRPDRTDGLFRKGLGELGAAGAVAVPVAAMDRPVGLPDVYAIAAVRRYIRANGPFDIVHGHSSKAGLYARMAGLGLTGERVYTPHAFMTTNPELTAPGRMVYRSAERLLGMACGAVICVSEEEKSHAAGLGLARGKLFVVPNGADRPDSLPDKMALRASLGLPGDAVIIGFVGRFVPQKDPGNLIRAFAGLAQRIPEARLAMAGFGPMEGEIRGLAEGLGLSGRIHWLGVQDGPSIMGAFDVFCLPSRYEGFPYVLIEAMGRGLPIVTTEIGGAGVLIEKGGNGLVVPPGRDDLLSSALGGLAADAGLRGRMGARSLQRAALFTVDRMVLGTETVYRGLISGRQGVR